MEWCRADGLRPITPKERQLTHRSLSFFVGWGCAALTRRWPPTLFFFSSFLPGPNPTRKEEKKRAKNKWKQIKR